MFRPRLMEKADIASKKKELGKKTLAVKTRQKEVQTADLELRAYCR